MTTTQSLAPRPTLALHAYRAAFSGLGHVSASAAARLAFHRYFAPRRFRPSPREIAALAPAKKGLLETPGGTLATYVFEHGPCFPWERRDRAGTVLLVHGWEGRAGQLASFIEPLRSLGHRVVAVDLPAHGRAPGSRTDLLELAAALRAASAVYGPFRAAIAHSFGGPAVVTALEEGLLAERVVLIGSPARLGRGVERYAQLLGFREPQTRALRGLFEARFGADVWERFDVARASRAHAHPALFIHDREDREVAHEESVWAAGAWPGARRIDTAGLGHRRILRDRGVIEEVLRFVAAEPATDPRSAS